MKCHKCFTDDETVFVQLMAVSYWYCRACKVEVLEPAEPKEETLFDGIFSHPIFMDPTGFISPRSYTYSSPKVDPDPVAPPHPGKTKKGVGTV